MKLIQMTWCCSVKVGDLVQANKFANWSARQTKFGFVLEIIDPASNNWNPRIRVLLGGDVKVLPSIHFEVLSESR